MAAFYRDQPDDRRPCLPLPHPGGVRRLEAEPVDRQLPARSSRTAAVRRRRGRLLPVRRGPVRADPAVAAGRRDHAENAFPDPNEIPAERILELNQQALAYYESCYPRSWAPGYLRERLGTDLTDHPTYAVGYAPGAAAA